ncbi:MAG: DegV family protein [Eubacterium sp.]
MVKIIADSTCDLSDATLKKYDIDMLPLYIHMGENEYKDRLEVTVEDIFKWSDQYNTTPKTSAPSIEDAQNAIIPYMEKNADIIMFATFQKICQQLPMLCDLLQTILNMKIMYL